MPLPILQKLPEVVPFTQHYEIPFPPWFYHIFHRSKLMIQHLTHVYGGLEPLRAALSTETMTRLAEASTALLVQIYSAETDRARILPIVSLIADQLPRATVVGASTVGEIAHGRLMTHQTVIGFTFFASSELAVVAMACHDGDERAVGAEIGRRARQCGDDLAGVLLLVTPLSMDAAALLEGMESVTIGRPVFGGGAGDYAAMAHSLVFAGSAFFDQGAVAVVFAGRELSIEPRTYLGWRPLSRAMRITQVDGMRVQTIDDRPAFEVYQRYLNIANDDQFFLNALEFPLLLERDGELLARVPIAADESGALQFVADVRAGEIVRLGYGDLELIVQDAEELHRSMARFSPQAVFLYTCGCRRFLMQEDVELETLPFETFAPTFGFYTYGEFFGATRLTLLNSTMVAVSLREGASARQTSAEISPTDPAPPVLRDPYANKHARIIARLLRFISTVTAELEASNRAITKLSITDRLTQLVNRIRLDQVLGEQIELASRYGTPFAVILVDVDHFKQVNDLHGHLIGDEVLVRVAHALRDHTRKVDVVGRWGGEEFMVIAPNTGTDEAAWLAEKLRLAIERIDIPDVGRKTCSFGVTAYEQGDDPTTLVSRADAALYAAKAAGRNRVEIGACNA